MGSTLIESVSAIIAVDLYPIYPEAATPKWMAGLREWYIATYQDQFFVSPP